MERTSGTGAKRKKTVVKPTAGKGKPKVNATAAKMRGSMARVDSAAAKIKANTGVDIAKLSPAAQDRYIKRSGLDPAKVKSDAQKTRGSMGQAAAASVKTEKNLDRMAGQMEKDANRTGRVRNRGAAARQAALTRKRTGGRRGIAK